MVFHHHTHRFLAVLNIKITEEQWKKYRNKDKQPIIIYLGTHYSNTITYIQNYDESQIELYTLLDMIYFLKVKYIRARHLAQC
jgi:translation initiation factor 1 (eIF-1/SUI1)